MARRRSLASREGATRDEGPDRDPAWVARVRRGLVAWYREFGRALPWRVDRDPYRILVSEMMLVQTTVAAVVPYFERFVERFPTVADLAAAEETEVLKLWEGLGYYRRARQLHEAARAIVARHGGKVPADPEALRALPGVGRYVAGAIGSFAFDRPVPILEANTQRVVARWLACREDLQSSAARERLWRAAERLVPPEGAGAGAGAGEFNQAFMELGALVCAPRAPRCLVCPVATDCRARALGIQESVPATTPKAPPLAVSEACALVRRSGRLLIVQRGPGRLWEHFWEFPTIRLGGADPAGRSFGAPVDLAEGVRRLTGVTVEIGTVARTLRYSVTKHRVELTAYWAVGLDGDLRPGPGLERAAWVDPDELGQFPFGAAGRRLAALAVRDRENG